MCLWAPRIWACTLLRQLSPLVIGFSQIFDENEANKNWDVNFHAEDYLTLFPKEQIVYLTSESENVISDLDESKVYVIGGLIDHNAHKGLCFKIAREKGTKRDLSTFAIERIGARLGF